MANMTKAERIRLLEHNNRAQKKQIEDLTTNLSRMKELMQDRVNEAVRYSNENDDMKIERRAAVAFSGLCKKKFGDGYDFVPHGQYNKDFNWFYAGVDWFRRFGHQAGEK